MKSKVKSVYERTKETILKNESSFEIVILRGVILAFTPIHRSTEKKLGLGLVVLKVTKVITQRHGFFFKDSYLYRSWVI